MKYFRVILPMVVVIATVLNFVFAYYSANSSAMWANVTALFGWLVIAGDEFSTFRRAQLYKDAV